MDIKNLFPIALIAVSYYLFSNEFFKFAAEIKGERVTYQSRVYCFLFVYVWFVIASYLELPLLINWFIFLILLVLEVHMVFSFDFIVSFAVSMFCAIMGLAVNVFFRSLFSILLGLPLNVFDNALSSLKTYPIFLGFMAMIPLLHTLRRIHFSDKLRRMLEYRKSLIFYTWTEICIYLFLIIQLLAFSQSGDEIGIKAWGIKSSLFSIFVLVISIIYSMRVASLHYYMQKQHKLRDHLIQEKEDINKLWKLAYTDMLTGLSNRQLLDKRLEEYAGYGGVITMAFIDVNGLKAINDQYGHLEGDGYLIGISRILLENTKGHNIDLFRYGGDEFVMISNSMSETEITQLLIRANEQIQTIPSPYPKSISYGVVHGECADYHALIVRADDLMYRHKIKHYENIARS